MGEQFLVKGAGNFSQENWVIVVLKELRFSGEPGMHEVKIAPWQAVLGDQIIVPTLEGNARLKLPPGTQGGQRFRLRGRGLPGVSGQRGDLYVVVQITVPKKLSDSEQKLWEQLAQLHGSEKSD